MNWFYEYSGTISIIATGVATLAIGIVVGPAAFVVVGVGTAKLLAAASGVVAVVSGATKAIKTAIEYGENLGQKNERDRQDALTKSERQESEDKAIGAAANAASTNEESVDALAALEKQLKERQTELDNANKLAEEKSASERTAQQSLTTIKRELAEEKAASALIDTNLTNAKGQLAKKELKIIELQKNISTKEAELLDLQGQVRRLEQQHKTRISSPGAPVLDNADRRLITQLQSDLASKNKQLDATIQSLADAKNELEKFRNELIVKTDEVKKFFNSYQHTKTLLMELNAKIDSDAKEIENNMNEKDGEIDRKNKVIASIQQELKNAEQQISENEQALFLLQEKMQTQSKEVTELRAQLRKTEESLQSLVDKDGELERVKQSLESQLANKSQELDATIRLLEETKSELAIKKQEMVAATPQPTPSKNFTTPLKQAELMSKFADSKNAFSDGFDDEDSQSPRATH